MHTACHESIMRTYSRIYYAHYTLTLCIHPLCRGYYLSYILHVYAYYVYYACIYYVRIMCIYRMCVTYILRILCTYATFIAHAYLSVILSVCRWARGAENFLLSTRHSIVTPRHKFVLAGFIFRNQIKKCHKLGYQKEKNGNDIKIRVE